MGLLKKLNTFLTSASGKDREALWIYVRCASCGEKLRTRVNLYNDLSINFGTADCQDTYFCRKTLVGNQQCFRRIEIKLVFNLSREIIEQEVIGGEFILAEEFLAGEVHHQGLS